MCEPSDGGTVGRRKGWHFQLAASEAPIGAEQSSAVGSGAAEKSVVKVSAARATRRHRAALKGMPQVPDIAANLGMASDCALAITSVSMRSGDSSECAAASGAVSVDVGGQASSNETEAHGEHGRDDVAADVNALEPVHAPHVSAGAQPSCVKAANPNGPSSSPAAPRILEGVAQTWVLEKSLAAACPQYETMLQEALSMMMTRWPSVLRVLQNATAQRQEADGNDGKLPPLGLLFVNGHDTEVQDLIKAVVAEVLDTQVQSTRQK